VTGRAADGKARVLVSSDGGTTFDAHDLPSTGLTDAPYIAAVDPTNADVVYVRTSGAIELDGVSTANDALLRSDDAGASFSELFRAHAELLGFALSPDGSTVLLGYGSGSDEQRTADPAAFGIYQSSTNVSAFARVFDGPTTCLAWTRSGVYVCTPELATGFALGFAPGAEIGDESFVTLLRQADVRGPPCCADAPRICAEEWQGTCLQLRACEKDAAAGASCAANGGAAGALATSGRGTNAAARASHDAVRTPRSNHPTGCAFRCGRGRESGLTWLMAVALEAVAGRRKGGSRRCSRARLKIDEAARSARVTHHREWQLREPFF
jgi:hypothetical protein